MPNIRQDNAPQGIGLQPTETGIDAALQVARRGGAFFNQAGDAVRTVGDQEGRMYGSALKDAGDVAVDMAQHQEVSHGAAAYAVLNDKLTQSWNDTAKSADPNDPTVAAKFQTNVLEPALEQYRQGFLTEGGQKFAEARIESLRNHMFEKTSADMSTLAADAVSVNVRTTANSLSNTAMKDPSAVLHLIDSADGLVGDMVNSSPNLKGAPAARAKMQLTETMKENIVKSGAIGAIQKSADPEKTAQEWGDKYPQYISGADLKTLSANARQQIRADRLDAAYADHLNKQAQQDRSDEAETGVLKKLYSDNPQDQESVSTKAVVNDPNLTRTAKERMIQIVNREIKPETDAQASNANYIGVLSDIRSGKISDVGPIYQARIDGKINRGDFTQAIKDFTDFKSPTGEALSRDRADFFKRYAPTIDGNVAEAGIHSALGLQKMYAAEKDARRQEDFLRTKGQDPNSLYDPASPNFFGKSIMKYHVSMQDAQSFDRQTKQDAITQQRKDDAPEFAPPAGWQYSQSRKQYRDPTTNTVYDLNGKPVK